MKTAPEMLRPLAFVIALVAATASPLCALNPALPPSGNFDLTHWNITLPVDSTGGFSGTPVTINTATLSSGYEYVDPSDSQKKYFLTGPDGAMVFQTPWNGARSGTGASPRSELRETNPDGTLYNWTASSSGGTHTLDATCTVNAVGFGKVIIGQIHGKEPNIPAVILRYDNTVTPARIYVTVKHSPNDPDAQTIYYFPGVPLNTPITYQLKLVGGQNSVVLHTTVNGTTQSVDMYATDPNWTTTTFYFKAGSYYPQVETGVTAQVSFYELVPSHGMGATPPTISTTTLPAGRTTISYGNQALAASGGTTPYTWSLASGTLPTGLSLSSGGIISGTPTTAGTANFTARVTDADSQTDTQALAITINQNSVPSISTVSLAGGSVGTAYSQSVVSAGGDIAWIWTVASGALPPGLALSNVNNQTATLSGTPTTVGSYGFTLRVADVDGDFATQSYTVDIAAGGDFSVAAAPSSRTVARGASTTFTATVSGINGFAGTVNLTVSGLPFRATASFAPGSVTGSGTSTLTVNAHRKSPVGAYPLTITGTSGGLVRTTTVTLVVQ